MKKLLFVAILGTLVACGESSSTETTTDTTTVNVESSPITVDTSMVDSSNTMMADTSAQH